MWAQAWGMWSATFALACAWRALCRGRSRALAAGLLAAALCSHLPTGLLVAAIVAGWSVLLPRPVVANVEAGTVVGSRRTGRRSRFLAWSAELVASWRRRVVATIVLIAVAGAASAWMLIPSLVDGEGTWFQNPEGTFWRDSFGVRQVLTWLASGELFDADRFPVVTIAAAIGLLVACAVWWRPRPRPSDADTPRWIRAVDAHAARAALPRDTAAALVVAAAVSLVVFCGTTLVGPVVDRLPARDALPLHRAISGVHLSGVLLSGVGVSIALRALVDAIRSIGARQVGRGSADTSGRLVPVAGRVIAGVLALLALSPAIRHVDRYLSENASWIADQRRAEATDGRDVATLAGIAAAEGGRIYGGGTADWGATAAVGFIPLRIDLLNLDMPVVGFSGRVPALTEPSEVAYSSDSAGQNEAFDVRWHIRPSGMQGPPNGRFVAAAGRYQLWRVPTSGPMTVVDTTAAIETDRADLGAALAPFLRSALPLEGRYPVLALDGDQPARPTLTVGTPASPAGQVAVAHADDDGNRYAATVDADRAAAVLVKTAYHPRWQARVDGEPAETVMVAPGLLAVEVPAGRHTVDAHFAGFPALWRSLLIVLGVAALAELVALDRRPWRRTRGRQRRRRRADPSATSGPRDGSLPPDRSAAAGPPA
jgi:hypothetical protein